MNITAQELAKSIDDFFARISDDDLSQMIEAHRVTDPEVLRAMEGYFGTWKVSGVVAQYQTEPIDGDKSADTANLVSISNFPSLDYEDLALAA